MSLQDWVRNGWASPHKSTRDEIQKLLSLADRDLASCGGVESSGQNCQPGFIPLLRTVQSDEPIGTMAFSTSAAHTCKSIRTWSTRLLSRSSVHCLINPLRWRDNRLPIENEG